MKRSYKLAILLIVLIIIILFPTLIIVNPGLLAFIIVEAVITLLYYAFILNPLSSIIAKNKQNIVRPILLVIRIILITIMYLIFKEKVINVDSTILIYGAFILFFISIFKNNKQDNNQIPLINISEKTNNSIQVKCSQCYSLQESSNKFCTNCGTELNYSTTEIEQSKILSPYDFDNLYRNDEETMLEEFINKELEKADLDKDSSLIPLEVLKKKKILNIIYSILIFVYISLIFFHFPIYTYIIGLIILIILKKVTNKYNFIEYLKKEIKSRPSEKISNIIMNTKTSMVLDNQKKNRLVFNIIAILLPLVIFINPRIMYEDIEGGYAVRFYAFGLLNFQSAEIPAEHNGKPVISLRGNTFSNMPFLKEVKLPDTIKEIRGQAFKNDLSLTKVNIPTNLEYLGGGAFYNCLYIKEVELPDTLTFLGGESFYNAISLTKVKLSDNLTEIRGNTFENCHSLESITIPDKVERIGGHAFYGNSSLQEVNITENSKLREIGSSAFRLCSSLKSITLPSTTYVNGRAFKESPTEIKKFGEIDYNNLVDKTKYARNFYIHLYYIGNTQTVNPYIKDAIIYNTNITFIDAKLVDGSYQYTLKYTDETGETTFIIDKDNLYKEINENLVFSIGSKYSLESFNSGFSLNVYYN